MPPPPLPQDRDHLRTLAVCHYVAAGLVVPGLAFLWVHYFFMRQVWLDPEMWANMQPKLSFNPAAMFEILQWMYPALAVYFIASAGLAGISGWCIQRRKARMFSVVVAAVNCLHFPLGLLLGVFTLIVLNRESVMRVYADAGAGAER